MATTNKFTIDEICYLINRRILKMDYHTETQVREYLNDLLDEDDKYIIPDSYDAKHIANLLGTNENCIMNILGIED